MGFLQGLGKLLSGKPVFDGSSSERRDDTALLKHEIHQDVGSGEHRTSFTDANGNKIIPEVVFKNFKSHIDGSKATTTAWVMNTSPFEIELIKTEVLGHRQDIHRRLKPSEGHEVRVYDGPVITHEHDHRAVLYYKILENNDLFLAEYTVEFNREPSGTFVLEEFHRKYPPRDI